MDVKAERAEFQCGVFVETLKSIVDGDTGKP